MRIALDVEEQISRVGLGKQAEPTLLLGWQQLVRMRSRDSPFVLQPRLTDEADERTWSDPHRQWSLRSSEGRERENPERLQLFDLFAANGGDAAQGDRRRPSLRRRLSRNHTDCNARRGRDTSVRRSRQMRVAAALAGENTRRNREDDRVVLRSCRARRASALEAYAARARSARSRTRAGAHSSACLGERASRPTLRIPRTKPGQLVNSNKEVSDPRHESSWNAAW